MNYFEAESMRQEMIVAMKYKDLFPSRYIEVAKKYTADKWVECGETILQKLADEEKSLFDFLALIEMARKMEVEL